MFSWLKKLFKRDLVTEDDGSEKTYDAPSYEDALCQNALRAFQSGKPVIGEWDGEQLTNRILDDKK